MKRLLFFALYLFVALNTSAQQKATYKLPADLVQFFQGKWTGKGQFASGKKIEADLVYTLSLDSCWLNSTHTDKAPGKYKAMLMWGCERQTGEFVAYNFDNFQGHRQFTSDGWKDGKLVLITSKDNPNGGKFHEHFIYEKLSADSFKMTYETSRDGTTWKMCDYLIFKRNS